MANYSRPTYYARETNLMYRVYAWMCVAVALTAATAYYISTIPSLIDFINEHPVVIAILFVAQLGLVFGLSMFLNRMNMFTAVVLFLLYAASLGITLSTIFIVFELPSIFATFVVASGMFGAMAAYGYFTKADLTSLGSFGFMAIIGLIIGGIVNMFLKSAAFDYFISACGVIVFTLLTAYDVQKIKQMTQEAQADHQTMSKLSIMGALVLYLDFVNLFLYLLRFMGKRKD